MESAGAAGRLSFTRDCAQAVRAADEFSSALARPPSPPIPASNSVAPFRSMAAVFRYTGNYVGLIGKLDPRTREITEYKMPDPKASDPHTPMFDQHGILWFTVGRKKPRRIKHPLSWVFHRGSGASWSLDNKGETTGGTGNGNTLSGPSLTTTGNPGFCFADVSVGGTVDQAPLNGNE
jgi:hypothetical protein